MLYAGSGKVAALGAKLLKANVPRGYQHHTISDIWKLNILSPKAKKLGKVLEA